MMVHFFVHDKTMVREFDGTIIMKTDMSYFQSVADKQPTIINFMALSLLLVSDPVLKSKTLASRDARGRGDKALADRLKKSCGAITPSAICEGGHRQENVVALTQYGLYDGDHIPIGQMDEVVRRVKKDSHTLLAYITNSGSGIRVIYQWEATDADGVVLTPEFFTWDSTKETQAEFLQRVLNYHRAAFAVGNEYYSRLTGIPFDSQTKDVTRLSLLAHDADAFFCPIASVFTITPAEIARYGEYSSAMAFPQQHVVSSPLAPAARTGSVATTRNSRYTNVFDLIEAWVSHTTLYAHGSWNRYVMRCGYLLCEFGVAIETAIDWATARFSDYRSSDVRSIIRSCYRRAEFGKRTFYATY